MAFRLNILADFYWETYIGKVLSRLSDVGYHRYFEEKNYGTSLNGITIVLICQNPELNLKPRIRFVRKTKTIYLDIILDFNQFLNIHQNERERIVIEKLISEVPAIISKYKLEDFNLVKFETDLKNWMSKIL